MSIAKDLTTSSTFYETESFYKDSLHYEIEQMACWLDFAFRAHANMLQDLQQIQSHFNRLVKEVKNVHA